MAMRQKMLAILTTAMPVLTGMNALVQAVNTLTDYGCKRGWWEVGCMPATTRGHIDGCNGRGNRCWMQLSS